MQLSLDLPPPLARRSDPSTSHTAAAAARAMQKAHADEILACLRKYGPSGKTGIASRTCLDHIAVARRLPEMERHGLVALTGRKVLSAAGNPEREWTVAA